MSDQVIKSDLLVELPKEEQQLLSGGGWGHRGWGGRPWGRGHGGWGHGGWGGRPWGWGGHHWGRRGWGW